jgi:hypothetical protein
MTRRVPAGRVLRARRERTRTKTRIPAARALFSAIAIGSALIAPRAVHAQNAGFPLPTADDVFERAKALLKAGDWVGACAKFQESFDLEPSVSALVKIARCREHEGRSASALLDYRRALELNRTTPEGASRAMQLDEIIRTELGALEMTVPTLRLVISPRPSALEVRVDGRVVTPQELDTLLPVDPGEREIVVRAPGYGEERVRVTISGRAQREVRVALHAQEIGAPGTAERTDRIERAGRSTPEPAATETDPARHGWAGQSIAGLVMGGAGVATLGVAGYFGYRTLSLVADSRSYCDQNNQCLQAGLDRLNDARQAQTMAIVLAGTGATLAAAGFALFFTASPPAGGVGPKAAVGAAVAPLGVSVSGSF